MYADPDVSLVLKLAAGAHFTWAVIKAMALGFALLAMAWRLA